MNNLKSLSIWLLSLSLGIFTEGSHSSMNISKILDLPDSHIVTIHFENIDNRVEVKFPELPEGSKKLCRYRLYAFEDNKKVLKSECWRTSFFTPFCKYLRYCSQLNADYTDDVYIYEIGFGETGHIQTYYARKSFPS